MRLSDGLRLNTAPSGIWTRWPSGKRISLYDDLVHGVHPSFDSVICWLILGPLYSVNTCFWITLSCQIFVKINRNDSAEKHFWEMVCTGEFQSYSNKSLLFFPLLSLSNYLKKLLKIRNMIYFWVTEIKPYQMAYRKSLSLTKSERPYNLCHISYVTWDKRWKKRARESRVWTPIQTPILSHTHLKSCLKFKVTINLTVKF